MSLREFKRTIAGKDALKRAPRTCTNCWNELAAHADVGLHCLFEPTVFNAATQIELLKREYVNYVKLHYTFYGAG